ncbi:hypothetical protein [Pannonibacter phragmitetus]|uniref:endonuclease toxin domain-containing protein n=1 Tax=Pannonibacter phragmitetus TaxID=121719 RepID=UPI001AD90853|nr:hypothetical protein [Pannonibacter phragmitetus]
MTPGTLELSDQRQDLASLNRDAGAAHVSVEAYDIARLKARQEGAAALSQLLNGLTGDLSAEIGLKDGDPAKAALHAAAGAAVAAVAGTDIGTGAAAGLAQELIGAAVNDVLMSNPQLTQAQRNALSQWAAAALGSVIGGASGAAAALDADRFNRQLHMAEADLIRANAARYAVEQGYCESIAACDAEAVSRATLELTSETLRGVSDDFDYLEVNSNARAFLNGLAQAGQQVDGQTLFGELDRKGSEYRNSLINISTVLQTADTLGLLDTREGRTMLSRAYALAADEIGPHFNEVGRSDVLSLLSGMDTLASIYEAIAADILTNPEDPAYADVDPMMLRGELSASASRLRNMIKIAVVRGSGHFTFTEKLGGGGPETRIMAQAYAENLASFAGGLDGAMGIALRRIIKNGAIGAGKGVGEAVDRSTTGIVWGKGIQDQGMPWENYLATKLPADSRLPPNFKTFDFFDPGTQTAISAKTLDTTTAARTIRPQQVYSTLKRNIDAVARFEKYELGERTLNSSQIKAKELHVAVPSATNNAQWEQIKKAVQYGQSNGVTVKVTRIQ